MNRIIFIIIIQILQLNLYKINVKLIYNLYKII